jgi:Lrp/AsnC family transcriptional regulator for asnA, asnC and gidA
MEENLQIDILDKKILELLMQNSRISYLEIARASNVAGATIHLRMSKMEQLGIVKGSVLLVNPEKLGLKIGAFICINLQEGGMYDAAASVLKDIPEVTECSYVTGSYSMFIKIYCRDTNHLREVLTSKIQKVQGVKSTETFIILEQSINRQVQV